MKKIIKGSAAPTQPAIFNPAREKAPAAERQTPPVALPTEQRHIQLLERIAEEFVREREQLLNALRPELLRLALAIAREIIGYEVSCRPEIIENTLAQALQNLHFATHVVVRLHPEDLAHLQAHSRLPQLSPSLQLELVADESIERGGCVLASDYGGFEATLEGQLQALREALAASYLGSTPTDDASSIC